MKRSFRDLMPFQVIKDFGEDIVVSQKGDDGHRCVALRTSEHVDVEDSAEKVRPSQPPGAFPMGGDIRSVVFDFRSCSVVTRRRLLHVVRRRGRRQAVPKAGAVCEDPVIADEIRVWSRNQSGQTAHERQGIEDDLSPPVEPRPAKLIMHLPVRVNGEPLKRQGRPQSIAAETPRSTASTVRAA